VIEAQPTDAARAWRSFTVPFQYVRFCVVGASGYLVNLAVFALCLSMLRLGPSAAAVCSFGVASGNNYAWNRLWTFADRRGRVGAQLFRYLVVALFAVAANVALLRFFGRLGLEELPAQAVAIVVVSPITFAAAKLWSFRR
jgi:putative flippase GtrA